MNQTRDVPVTAAQAPAPILSNVPGSFPEGVLRRRHPDLIVTVRRLVPCPREVQEALDALLATLDGVIPGLPAHAHGAAAWRASAAGSAATRVRRSSGTSAPSGTRARSGHFPSRGRGGR